MARLLAVLSKLDVGDASVRVEFARNPKARRYILRMRPNGAVRVTVPRGGSLVEANLFAERNKAWIEKQLAKTRGARDWEHGTLVMLRGSPTPILIENGLVRLGSFHFGAPVGELRTYIEACLRMAATAELREATVFWAARLGIVIRDCQVRDQRTRWGSCSSRAVINLNWRLIQTPEFVRDYIIVHELMHRREMNHSDRFWAHVSAAYPRYEEAERWLRKNAALLR